MASSGRLGPRVLVALGLVYLVWGSTYLAIRVLVRSAPPLLSAGARFLIAGLILGAILSARGGLSRLRVTRSQLTSCAVLGLLLPLGGNGLVTLAEQDVPSGAAALVIAAVPLFVVIIRVIARDRPRIPTICGVLIGFAGIAALADPGGGADFTGIALLLVAALLWAYGSWVQARLQLPSDPFVTAVWEMATGGVALMVVGLLHGEPGDHPITGITGDGWLALAYLVVFGSLVGFTAYVWLLHTAPISLVATYAYVNPAVAVLLGAVLLGEAVTARVMIGGAVVLVAVALVIAAESRSRPRAPLREQP